MCKEDRRTKLAAWKKIAISVLIGREEKKTSPFWASSSMMIRTSSNLSVGSRPGEAARLLSLARTRQRCRALRHAVAILASDSKDKLFITDHSLFLNVGGFHELGKAAIAAAVPAAAVAAASRNDESPAVMYGCHGILP